MVCVKSLCGRPARTNDCVLCHAWKTKLIKYSILKEPETRQMYKVPLYYMSAPAEMNGHNQSSHALLVST